MSVQYHSYEFMRIHAMLLHCLHLMLCLTHITLKPRGTRRLCGFDRRKRQKTPSRAFMPQYSATECRFTAQSRQTQWIMGTWPNIQAHLALYQQHNISCQNLIFHIVSFHKMLCQTNLQFCMIAGKNIACAALRKVLCNDAQGCKTI